ncbi:MAG: hypothetical protein E7600_07985 [Ruminococcaceae bacterium]|nr:hypothetical protein [Oscillospiraceae bacterium]
MNRLPERKNIRLKGCTYSEQGAYFITVCTKYRKEILGRIDVGDGVLDVPNVILSKHGQIAEKYIMQMQNFYDNIHVEYYVIMPNHVHMILIVLNDVILKDSNGTSRTPSPTNTVISKFISTFKRFCNQEIGENIWQRAYHDHIIRNDDDLEKHIEYIIRNPLEWECDDDF